MQKIFPFLFLNSSNFLEWLSIKKDREIELAQKIFPTSLIPAHLLKTCRHQLWRAVFLSYPEPNMLWGARSTATPHLWPLFPSHIFRAHMVFPNSNSNLMWQNYLTVFVVSLLSYLEGRPAVPCRLPENWVSLMTGSVQGLWFEGCDGQSSPPLGKHLLPLCIRCQES